MDAIFNDWLEAQQADVTALAACSDRITVQPLGELPARRYSVAFDCQTLVRGDDGVVPWAGGCRVMFLFPADYVRVARDSSRVLALQGPRHLHHPNILHPFICLGNIAPGTGLVELIERVYDLLSFRPDKLLSGAPLNPAAYDWAREHMALLPTDTRPLRRPPPQPGAIPAARRDSNEA